MRHQRGFTLFEVLVALTLMGLLIAVLFGGFRAGLRSWQVMDGHLDRTEEPRQLSSLMYRHLTQLTPIMLRNENFRPEPSFRGEKERIRYAAPLAMSVGDAPYLVEISNGQGGKPGVWIRFAPARNGARLDSVFAEAPYQRVSETLSISFAYFFEGEWLDAVPLGREPQLISVQLKGPDVVWPRMVLPIARAGGS